MRLPARFIAGQLIWTHAGTTWAVWRVNARTYPYLGTREKLDLHARTRGAIMALGTESMLVSVCERVDPAAVVEAMVDGVDLEAHSEWAEVASATLDTLADSELYRRHHFVAVELAHSVTRSAWQAAVSSARAQVGGRFGLAGVPVRQAEVLAHQRQADRVGGQLRAMLGPEAVRPATAGEVVWLYARAPRRGLDEPPLDEAWEPALRVSGSGPDAVLRGPSLTVLGDAVFKEGGDDDDIDRPRRHRRYLKVETEVGVAYQALLVVSDMPSVFAYPGGAEALARADAMAFPVEWCVRVRPTSNADAVARTKRQARALQGQFDEYDGESAGPPPTLAAAVEAIDHERAALAANPAEPELETTIIFAVWASTLDDLESRAGQLRAVYEVNEYGLPRPTGGQLALYGAMQLGSPLPPVARDYTQFGLVGDLAAQAPWAGIEVGDPRGGLWAVSLDGGTAAPVLFDWGYGPSVNRSGSVGMFGSLGAGKSHAAKRICWDTIGRGGQVVAVDRTPMGEYVRLAEVVPGTAQVVHLSPDAQVCLDPMAVFAPAERVRYTTGFLTLLTGTSPTDNEGAALAEAVRVAARQPSARLGDVVEALGEMAAANPRADDVYHRLANFARGELAGVVFGAGEAMRLDADYLVFHLPGLSLPDKEVLENPQLARQLLPEQIFSQALLYLVAAVARSVAFADRGRFAGVLLDEAWALTSNLQGRQLVLEMIRDGRKHRAGVMVLSQHPSDLGDRRLADLLGSRMVFRQSRAAARAALEFLGMEPSASTVDLLEMSLGTGQCLYRDVADRIGLVQVLPAPFPELRAAFDTNPEEATAGSRRRVPAVAAASANGSAAQRG